MSTNIFDDKDIWTYTNIYNTDNDNNDDNHWKVEEKENVSIGKPQIFLHPPQNLEKLP